MSRRPPRGIPRRSPGGTGATGVRASPRTQRVGSRTSPPTLSGAPVLRSSEPSPAIPRLAGRRSWSGVPPPSGHRKLDPPTNLLRTTPRGRAIRPLRAGATRHLRPWGPGEPRHPSTGDAPGVEARRHARRAAQACTSAEIRKVKEPPRQARNAGAGGSVWSAQVRDAPAKAVRIRANSSASSRVRLATGVAS